jgi:Na+-driven multidrug efflux pump
MVGALAVVSLAVRSVIAGSFTESPVVESLMVGALAIVSLAVRSATFRSVIAGSLTGRPSSSRSCSGPPWWALLVR